MGSSAHAKNLHPSLAGVEIVVVLEMITTIKY
jgi:hypothetical protein